MEPPRDPTIEEKKAAMLKKLNRRRTTYLTKCQNNRNHSAIADLEVTERAFVEQQSFTEAPTMDIADISMIQSDTFIVNTPRRLPGPLTSTPFHPKKKPSFSSPRLVIEEAHESYVNTMERQFNALSGWCNTLLNMCNRFEDGVVDLGKTKQDAAKRLQEILMTQRKEAVNTDSKKFKYKEAFCQQEFEASKQRAMEIFESSPIPQKIASMIQADSVLIREDMNVYSDIILKSTLMHVFLSFHPVWLHLGMEIVFGVDINIPDESSFLSTMTNFLNMHLFADPMILRNKKYVIGTVKLLLSDIGKRALHRHFLTKTCQFLFCVETFKTAGVIMSDPRLFVRKSQFKSLQDVFGEFSREALASSGLSLNKAFAKIGFQPKYVQNYFDELQYKVETFADLTDGVHLGKLVEIANKLGRGTVMSRLRNPRGDRLSKISNVATVLQIAANEGIDVEHIIPENIVRGNQEVILQVLWKIIGIYVVSSGGTSDAVIQELHEYHDQQDIEKKNTARENAVIRLQTYLRRFLATRAYEHRRLDELDKKNTRENAVIRLQTYLRRFLATRVYEQRRLDELDKKNTAREQAAIRLQAYLRRFLATRAYEHRRLDELDKKNTAREQAAIRLQAYLRRFLATRAYEHRRLDELDKKNTRENAVIRLQTYLRRFLATRAYEHRRLDELDKNTRECATICLQTYLRRFLATRVYEHRRLNEWDKNTRECAAICLQTYLRRFLAFRALEHRQKVYQLLRLRQSIDHQRTNHAAHELALKCLKTVRIPSLVEQNRAAIAIERVWRGYITRKRIQAEMDQLQAAAINYREQMENMEITQDVGRATRPAFVKLEEYSDMLFDGRLYRTKVAAICIKRLISLTKGLCHHFIKKCAGLPAIMDRMEQADRSPGEEEIVSALVDIMMYLVEQAAIDPELKAVILEHSDASLKILFHVFNAFYNNTNIVTNSASALIGIRNFSSEVVFEKSKYYINTAQRRFARLPANNPRRVAVQLLEKCYQ